MRGTCSSGSRGGTGLSVRLEPWFSNVGRGVVETCQMCSVNRAVNGSSRSPVGIRNSLHSGGR